MEFKQYLLIGALSTGLLTGCGSDSDDAGTPVGASYKGSVSEGSINEASEASFKNTSVQVVSNFVSVATLKELAYELPVGMPIGVSMSGGALVHKDKAILLKDIVLNLGKSNANLPVGAEFAFTHTSNCTGVTGSAVVTGTMPDSDPEMPVAIVAESIPEVDPVETTIEETYALTITFNNYCYDNSIGSGPEPLMLEEPSNEFSEPLDTEGMILNGYISSESTLVQVLSDGRPVDGSLSMTFNVNAFKMTEILSDESILLDMKVTVKNGDSYLQRIDMTVSSDGFSSAFSTHEECSEELDQLDECIDTTVFKGLDGNTYRIDNADSYTSNGDLVGLNGKIFDSSFGSMYMDAFNLSWCVDELGQPQLDTDSIILLEGDNEEDALGIRATECGVFESEILEGGAPR